MALEKNNILDGNITLPKGAINPLGNSISTNVINIFGTELAKKQGLHQPTLQKLIQKVGDDQISEGQFYGFLQNRLPEFMDFSGADMLSIELPKPTELEFQELYLQLSELSLLDRMEHVETIILQFLRERR